MFVMFGGFSCRFGSQVFIGDSVLGRVNYAWPFDGPSFSRGWSRWRCNSRSWRSISFTD